MSHEAADVSVEVLTAVLNCIATPVFLLRPDGQIVHVNHAGMAFVHSSLALRKTLSRLVPRRTSEAKTLAAVLARVAASRCPELVRLLARGGTVSLLMTVTPVPGTALVTACAVDLRAEGPRQAEWLKTAFNLSPQNAELADGLMSGLSLIEFSDKKRVTLGAARTRLKKLFIQTGTNSQATLVSTLLRAAIISPQPSDPTQ